MQLQTITRPLRDFDWFLALTAIGIVIFGTFQIHNAQPTASFWYKQLIGLGISLVAMLVLAFTDYRKLIHIAPIFYGFGLVLLVVVLIPGVGLKINGHRSWIGLPGVGQFQPSEFVKVTTALMMTVYLGRARKDPLSLKEMAIACGILAVPIGLIMLEPDAGSVLTYLPLLAVGLFLSSIRMWLVLAAVALSVFVIPVGYVAGVKAGAIKTYQQERIKVILDPENADRKGFGYHTWQSILTIGEGGLMGAKSSGGSEDLSQSTLKFLPEPHSDFIFAVTSEHTGFVGATALIFAYLVFLSRLIRAARRSPDRQGMLLIMILVGSMSLQIFINVGMAEGLLPVIGVPLPLMSAGLASLISSFMTIGIAASVQMRRFVN
jgi:rod shape determining protein RodA